MLECIFFPQAANVDDIDIGRCMCIRHYCVERANSLYLGIVITM